MMLTAGAAEFGRLGRDGDPTIPLPVDLPFPVSEIACVACGLFHTIIIHKDGRGFGFGDDRKFAMGTGSREIHPHITSIKISNSIKWAACSSFCTTYLLNDGRVLICCERSVESGEPLEMVMTTPAVYVTMGENGLSYALDSDGCIYRCGDCFGPITDPPTPALWTIPHDEPEVYSLPSPVSMFAGGVGFIIAITSDNKLYINGRFNNNSNEFVEIDSQTVGRVRSVHAYLQHAVIIRKDDNIAMAIGYNGFGQTGNGTQKSVNEFKEFIGLEDVEIESMSVGKFASNFITKDGRFFGCGFNRYGQLMLSHTTPNVLIAEEAVKNMSGRPGVVSCGNFHCVILIGVPPIECPSLKAIPLQDD